MSAVPEMWRRRCSILLTPREEVQGNNPSAFVPASAEGALEISDLHVTFDTKQEDVGSPDNCHVRVENLAADTENTIFSSGVYSKIIVQAGYWGAPFGVIFEGDIIQFRRGRTDPRTTYLDILAADGPKAYNYAVVAQSVAAGSTAAQRVQTVLSAMREKGIKPGEVKLPGVGGILPRGKVMFGLARAAMRQITQDSNATWSISRGRLNVTPVDGYLEGEAVELTAQTGLIGRAEQTEDGIHAKCLINPMIKVGGLVRLNNASINTTTQHPAFALPAGQLPYDRYVGVQMLADVAADGLYRVYVAEYKGDTRGQDWYCDLTLLAVNPVTNKVT